MTNVQDAVAAAAKAMGFELNSREQQAFPALIADMLSGLDALASLDELPTPVSRPWRRPTKTEDPFNAFAVLTDLAGPAGGPLTGRRVGLKDTIALAGVPLGNGTHLLDGYVPTEDAEMVVRLLAAGARIVGKTNCECLCASGASFTSVNGPVLNPYDPTRSAGGSSSGSAVAVATGAVDMAIGGDQGGSIRIPAAMCGIVGLKPTFGLVPYRGVASVDASIDHVGPMARSVRDTARLLSVIAGPGGDDPLQNNQTSKTDYVAACDAPAHGLRIGWVAEGCRPGVVASGVDAAVRDALARLAQAGAGVSTLSVPMHASGTAIWMPVILLGTLMGMRADGGGTGLLRDDMAGMVAHLVGWQKNADSLSDVIRLLLLAGEVERQRSGLRRYGQGHRLGRKLAAAYDAALATVDVIAMPTTLTTAEALPMPDATIEDRFARAVSTVANTAPFNLTGHPAISVPCGLSDGLPVGLMLIARHGCEAMLLRAAAAVEAAVPPMPSCPGS